MELDGALDDCLNGSNSPDSTQTFSQEHIIDDGQLNEDAMDNLDGTKRAEAIRCIEDRVISVLDQLCAALASGKEGRVRENGKCIDEDLEYESQINVSTKKNVVLELADRTKPLAANRSVVNRILRYPYGIGGNARSFAQLFKVLEIANDSLVNDAPVTKRDMYYRDVQLFRSQSVVDRLVDDIAATFRMDRSDLNVRATSKGLVCGSSLVIHLTEGQRICVTDSEGYLIPVGEDIASFSVTGALCWILVVEKDAVFQALCRLKLASHPALRGKGLIVTGKGYPDIATRQLVKTLSDNLPAIVPIMSLVDGDAYGIDIMSVFKFGSKAMRHEEWKLAAERVEWLGLWASELSELNIDKDMLIPITKHDEKKAHSMLRRTDMPTQWRKELMCMLHLRRKAEIEILSSVEGNANSLLLEYLVRKINHFVDSYQTRSCGDGT